MTAHDRPAFAQALGVLAETLGQPLTELRTEGYFAALQDLELEDVTHAIERALREESYPVLPTPGKLRQLAQGTQADEAEGAWLALTDAVRRIGYYGQPQLAPALQNAVQAVWGGWQGVCRDLPAPSAAHAYDQHRQRFLAAYRVLQVRTSLPLPAVRGLLS